MRLVCAREARWPARGSKGVSRESGWPAFGDGAVITGTDTVNLRFPGQYLAGETGLRQNWWREYQPSSGRYLQVDPLVDLLHYYRARYYDPKVGRFTSEDPSRFEEAVNVYAYVEDNPSIGWTRRDRCGFQNHASSESTER